MGSKGENLINLLDQAFHNNERTVAENLWKELSEFINVNDFTSLFGSTGSQAIGNTVGGAKQSPSAGGKTTTRLIDSTAVLAANTLTSAIHGTLTNPASPWLDLKFSGETEHLNDDDESVAALTAVVREIRTDIQESNFSDAMLKVYASHISLGNAAVFVEQDEEQGFLFTPLHMSQIAWAENHKGRVDSVFRKMILTLKQAYERWGDKLDDSYLEEYKKNPLAEVEFLQVLVPRDKEDIKLNEQGLATKQHRPIASYYLDPKSKSILEETGYYEMPIMGVRYHTMPGETYGRGPGHVALPFARTLNKLEELAIESETIRVRPPILASKQNVFGGRLLLKPGMVTVVNNVDGVKPFQLGGRTAAFEITEERLINSIKEAFFLDKLMLPDRTQTGEMTAFEVAERIKQTNTVLGPALSRLNHELLQPIVLRMFNIKLRQGKLKSSPAMKQFGASIQVVFNNQLAQAQRIQDVTTINQWAQTIGGLAQLQPTIVDNIDFDEVARFTAKTLGVPHEVLKDLKIMEQERQARQEQMQQQQMMENAPGLADAAGKIDQLGKGE